MAKKQESYPPEFCMEIFEYIEVRYNHKRINSAMDYIMPQNEEEEGLTKAA